MFQQIHKLGDFLVVKLGYNNILESGGSSLFYAKHVNVYRF